MGGKTLTGSSSIILGLAAAAIAAAAFACSGSSGGTQGSGTGAEPASAGSVSADPLDSAAGAASGDSERVAVPGGDVPAEQGDSELDPAAPSPGAAAEPDTTDGPETDATADTTAGPEASASNDTTTGDATADPGGGGTADTAASTPDVSGDAVGSGPIESTPREDVPSALRDPDDAGHPEPLIGLAEIRAVVPPDAIPALDDPEFEPAGEVDWLPPVEPVLALDVNGDARAYPLRIMTWHELVNGTVGGVPVTVSYCPLCNSAVAYGRRAAGRILDFGTSGALLNSSLVMYDRQTESLWSHYTGEAVAGHLTGTRLDLFPVQTVSFASFLSAHPGGLVLSADTGHARRYGQNPYDFYDNPDGTPFLFGGPYDDRLDPMTRVVALRAGGEGTVVPHDVLSERRVVPVTVGGRELVVLYEPGTASALDTSVIAEGRDVGATGVFDRIVDGREIRLEPAPGGGGFVDAENGDAYDILGRRIGASGGLQPVEHLDTFWFAAAAFYTGAEIVGG